MLCRPGLAITYNKAAQSLFVPTEIRNCMPALFSRRFLANAVLCALALMFGLVAFAGLASLRTPPEAREQVEKVFSVEVYDVRPVDIQEIITGFGTARAEREVTISAQVAGQIVETLPRLRVGRAVTGSGSQIGPDGQTVTEAGDTLVVIDPQTYIERVAQAESRLAELQAEAEHLDQEESNVVAMIEKVQAEYDLFEKELERLRRLKERAVASASELTRTELELRKYDQNLQQYLNQKNLIPQRRGQLLQRRQTAENALQLAKLDLERTRVLPPFSGVLAEVMVETGQYVRPGEPIARLTNIDRVEIPIPLPIEEFLKIQPEVAAGNRPSVKLAQNETAQSQWFGYVERVAPEADERTRTIKIYVIVDNAEQNKPLLPGTFVHARIDGPLLDNQLLVPRDAVVERRVFVVREGRTRRREVTIGDKLGSVTLVECGLSSGDSVVLTNLDVIYDGAIADVRSRSTLDEELQKLRVPPMRLRSTVQSEANLSGERN